MKGGGRGKGGKERGRVDQKGRGKKFACRRSVVCVNCDTPKHSTMGKTGEIGRGGGDRGVLFSMGAKVQILGNLGTWNCVQQP